jgi:hypothetical protein
MTGVGFLIGGIVTAVFSPPTAFAVSGIGVVLLVALGAGFRPVREAMPAAATPRPRPAAPSDGA